MSTDRKPLSFRNHVFVTWAAAALIFPALNALAVAALGAERPEVLAFAMFGLVWGLSTGWLLGMVLYALRNGVRGWRAAFAARAATVESRPAPTAPTAPTAPAPTPVEAPVSSADVVPAALPGYVPARPLEADADPSTEDEA